MGVSKNSGTPKWMVKIMENPENPMNKWMIWGALSLYFWVDIHIPPWKIWKIINSKVILRLGWGYVM